MATTIKSNELLPAMGMELVVLVDDFGTEQQLYLSIADAGSRDANISAAKQQMDQNVAAMHAYAKQTGAALPGTA